MKIDLQKTVRLLVLITLATLPCYLIRLNFFGIPTNLSEISAILTIASFFLYQKKASFRYIYDQLSCFAFPLALLLVGLLSSLYYENNFSLRGLSIIKSWFVLPIVFSAISINMFYEKNQRLKLFYALYTSFFLLSIIAVAYKIFDITTFDGRLFAIYSSPNELSMLIIFGLIFFPIIISTVKAGSLRKLLVFSLFPILLSLYWTHSYGTWAAFVIVLLMTFVFIKELGKYRRLLFLLVAIFLFFFFLQINTSKLSGAFDSNSSLSSRFAIWQSTGKMLSDSPMFGIGPGNFQEKYLQYQQFFRPYPEWAVPNPHNVFLAFWLYSGLLGLCAFLDICIKSVLCSLKNKNAILSAALFGSICYILIHGIVDTTVWKNDLSYIFWLVIAVSLGSTSSKNQVDKPGRPSCL